MASARFGFTAAGSDTDEGPAAPALGNTVGRHDRGIFERVVERLLIQDERYAAHGEFARHDVEIDAEAGANYGVDAPRPIGQAETRREVVSVGLEDGVAGQAEAAGFHDVARSSSGRAR